MDIGFVGNIQFLFIIRQIRERGNSEFSGLISTLWIYGTGGQKSVDLG